MVEKPILSPNFTIDDIHKLREYNYEMTKHMTLEEKMDYYNSKGREVLKELEKRKSGNSVLEKSRIFPELVEKGLFWK